MSGSQKQSIVPGAEIDSPAPPVQPQTPPVADPAQRRPREIGGRQGPEPTRYGDWEKDGRCIDF